MAGHKNEIDMLHGPLFGKLFLFAMPLMASMVLQQLFNMADTIVVGRFDSSQALAAVGSTAPAMNLLIHIFMGLSLGANVTVARLIGRNEPEKINDAIHTVMFIALLSGAFLFTWGMVMSKHLVRLLNTPPDVVDLATLYMKIIFMGTPFFLFYNFGAAILRAKGDTKRPLYCLTLAGVINVILNMILVIVFKLGVAGVAIATITSHALNATAIMYFLSRESAPFTFNFFSLFRFKKIIARFKREHASQVLRIGLPAGIQNSMFAISNTIIIGTINSFGSKATAGSTTALNIELIIYFIMGAFAQATVTFTSQNYGAGDFQRCKRVYWLSMLASFVGTALACAVCSYWRLPLLRLYTHDPDVLKFGEIRMLHVVAMLWIGVPYEIGGGSLRGLGHSTIPALIVMTGCCVFRVFWVATIFRVWNTFEDLMNVYAASWLVTGLLMCIALRMSWTQVSRTISLRE